MWTKPQGSWSRGGGELNYPKWLYTTHILECFTSKSHCWALRAHIPRGDLTSQWQRPHHDWRKTHMSHHLILSLHNLFVPCGLYKNYHSFYLAGGWICRSWFVSTQIVGIPRVMHSWRAINYSCWSVIVTILGNFDICWTLPIYLFNWEWIDKMVLYVTTSLLESTNGVSNTLG